MNWISGLQNAINYIEENITEELDYATIAQQAYSSNFHFQRIFGILCGYTLGEYIRNRRLSLAGNELASTNQKVIDIALKYGYQNPESFSRAFTKFHGITPTQARNGSAPLKSFSRLSVKLILEGGSIMDYKIVQKESFKMIIRKERFHSGTEIYRSEIHDFWNRSLTDGTIQTLCKHLKQGNPIGEAVTGFCLSNPEVRDFDYAIGVPYDGAPVEKGLSIEEIPENTWVIFQCVGTMPDAFQELWKKIYTEFFPTSDYEPTGMCIEVYPDNPTNAENYCEIWLAVTKK